MNIKLCEFIGFCQLFFRNDFMVRIKRLGLNWVSPVVPLSEIETLEHYKVYKNCTLKSFGVAFEENILNIYITC